MSKNQNLIEQNQNQNPQEKQKILESLSQSDVELLYQKRRIERAGGEAEVLDAETTDLIREVFGDALQSRGVRDTSTMSLESLARQFCDEEGEVDESLTIESLEQNVETGGKESDEDLEADADEDEEFSIEMLSPPDVRMGYERSKLIDAMEGRTPEHVESLKEDLADDLGCTVDELPEYREFADIVRG